MKTRRGATLVVVLLALVVNLPLGHGAWTDFRLDRDGEQVTATLVDHGTVGPEDDPRYFLEFRYPPEIDPEGQEWSIGVSEAAYDEAVERGEVEVLVLPGSPETFRGGGQETSGFLLGLTIFADLVLAGMLLLVWRFGGLLGVGRHDEVRLVATDDVERCRPGSDLVQMGDVWVARGEVVEKDERTVVLDLGDRRVVVELGGFTNPVGYQQPAQVVGRRVG